MNNKAKVFSLVLKNCFQHSFHSELVIDAELIVLRNDIHFRQVTYTVQPATVTVFEVCFLYSLKVWYNLISTKYFNFFY